MSSRSLIVFLKAPRSGFVKTRLAKAMGAERACEIYCELTETVLKQLCPPLRVELRYTPDDAADEISKWCREGWSMRAQGNGDLGERLHRAFTEAFAAGADSVAIIGSDCPDISGNDIKEAWKSLGAHDVVLGPATDGGYWLIALSRPQPELFANVPWGSDRVLQETTERARRAGLRVHLLRILSDIDTVEDWDEWSRK